MNTKIGVGSTVLRSVGLAAVLALVACAGPAEDAGSGSAAESAGTFSTSAFALDNRAELLAQRDGGRWSREVAGARADLGVRGIVGSNAGAFEASLARQRAGLAPRNAYWLARLSLLAYDEEAALKNELAAIGLPNDADHFHFFTNTCTGAQAFYVTNAPPGYADTRLPSQASPYFAALVFRGTEEGSTQDLNADLDALMVRAPVGHVHEGFSNQLTSVWNAPNAQCGLLTAIGSYLRHRHAFDGRNLPAARKGADLYMSGHSLGGALATLALATTVTEECVAARKQIDDPSCAEIYTPVAAVVSFGSPRVGDPGWAGWLGGVLEDRTALYRWVNEDDVVPKVPALLFRHVLSDDAEDFYRTQLNGDAAPTVGVHGVVPPELGMVHTMLANQIEDHRMKNYIANLGKLVAR